MEKRDFVLDCQGGNQAVNRTSDRESSFPQAPVDIGCLQVISEVTLDFWKEQEIIKNRLMLRIVPHSLENFLRDDSRDENGISTLKTLLEKKIFPRRSPPKEIDPDRSINEYPQIGPFSSLSNPPPTGPYLRDLESLWPFRGG